MNADIPKAKKATISFLRQCLRYNKFYSQSSRTK